MTPPGQHSLVRRIVAVLLVLLGVAGLVVSAAGVVGTWVGRDYLLGTGNKLSAEADNLLAVAADVLDRVGTGLRNSREALAAVPKDPPAAPNQPPRMSLLGSVAGRLFPDLQNAGRSLDTVAAGVVILNNVLAGLDDPELVRQASLDPGQVQELAGRVKGLGEMVARLRGLLEAGGIDPAAADGQAEMIDRGLADAIDRVDALAALVAGARSRVQEVHTRLEAKLLTVAVAATVFLAWFAVSQVGLILHGVRLWRPRPSLGVGVFVFAACLGGGNALLAGEEPTTRPASFEADVRPVFEQKCLRCHGDKTVRAGLDLRTVAGVLKGGESGRVVVPGKPDDSVLFQKVRSGAMPPNNKTPLSETELDVLRRWIASDEARQPVAAARQHDVIPIVLRHCTVCHGRHRQEGGLDLRTRAAMVRGGKSGPAVVPGKPGESLLVKKLKEGLMPPRERLVEASVKPVEPDELDVLVRWIAAGAPEVAVEPDVATKKPDPLVTDKDRDFWAFRPPRAVPSPAVNHAARVRNPIDTFVHQKLEGKGLCLSPEVDKVTLLRRASFDLTGLPPEPAEVEAFLADESPDAYERLIDRLLGSPRYGERWGRYWLDLAGYADSEGKREQDLSRPHAWRYRDYVIRSFNDDKPYDRFLTEQLAGDELADYENGAAITPEVYDNLVATGFLRMVPDATWANITGYLPDRLEVIADEFEVLGSGVMGLTLRCARCHDHKFDPIPQRDYYRMADVFKGALDEHDWLKPDVRPGLGPVSQDVLGGRLLPHVTAAERLAWERAKKENDKLAEPKVQAVWDRGEPSPTYIYRRGDPLNVGRLVGPGVPSVLTDGKTPFAVEPPWPGAKKTGRRLAFARWLTKPDHPLTARVMVNRLWKHHFGTGIVRTLGNFGRAGTPPSHPELLDFLATEFVRQGWSVKAMHRLMMTSATYRQSSAVTPEHEKLDPENALYSRMPLVRLDAEALYDSLLLVAGRLDEARYGQPDAVQARPDGLVTPAGTERGWRRLIYVRQMRKQLPTHLENFDFPQMNPNCLERRDSTVAPQALHLMNNGMVQQLAEHFARRIIREAGKEPEKQVERAYRVALGREPDAEESAVGVASLKRLAAKWGEHLKADPDAANLKALTTYCHALMNSASFLYVD